MTDIGGLNDKGIQRLGERRPQAGPGAARRRRPRLHLEDRRGLHPEPLDRRDSRAMTSSSPSGSSWRDAIAAVAKRFPNTKFAIIDVTRSVHEGQAEERPRASCSRSRRPGTSPASPRPRSAQDERDQLGRRPQDPAGRRVHRRLPVWREEGRSRASRRSTATRRTSSTRRSARRSRSTRSGKGSDVVFQVAGGCGLGALQGAKEKKQVGHRRGHRPGLPRQARPDERHEEGRRRACSRRSSSPSRRRARVASTRCSPSRTRASVTARSARRSPEPRCPDRAS